MTREKAQEVYGELGYTECPDIGSVVDDIYDDFESRTCESCKYYSKHYMGQMECTILSIKYLEPDFGCNKWEAKDGA